MKSIFTESSSGELVEMRLTAPEEERILQELIERHPILISLADENLMLVQREAGATGTEVHGERWSLDHLFVTPDAIPVLVEVKRATDTRIRRYVVGQMMDYAANGSTYWTADTMDAAFRTTCERLNYDPDETMAEFIAEGFSTEDFWIQVQANLRAGRLKLRFVADRIPEQLGRVVQFLNAHTDMEVLAVELGYFRSDAGETTLVPNFIGQTEKVVRQSRGQSEPNPLLQEISREFSLLDCPLTIGREVRGNHITLQYGSRTQHYEWQVRKGENELHVAVHFEGPDKAANFAGAEALQPEVEAVASEFNAKVHVGKWGRKSRKWASAGVVFKLSDLQEPSGAGKVAMGMAARVAQTLPKLAGPESG